MARLALAGNCLAADPCVGSQTAGSAISLARVGASEIVHLTQAKQASVMREARRFYRVRPKAGGDSDAFSVRYYGLAFKREKAKQAVADLLRVRRLMGTACRASEGRRTVRARVVSLDPASPIARLSDRTTLVLGAAKRVVGLAPGVVVIATGTQLKGRLLVARSVEAVGLRTKRAKRVAPPGAPQASCTFTPVIAPVQNFALSPSKILYYDQRGYIQDGKYLLEVGMGIGAKRGVFCTQKNQYAVSVFIDYQDTYGAKVHGLIGTKIGYPQSEPPILIPLPYFIDLGAPASLRFEVYGWVCELVGDVTACDQGQLESKTSLPLVLRRQGKWGFALYDRRLFSVEDGSKTDFDVAKLVGHIPWKAVLPGSPVVFGVGYEVKGGASTYPKAHWITKGGTFAVHDDVPSALFPTGLVWAYMKGSRDGHTYFYVATLPKLITDVVSFCPGTRPSYYRLPWKPFTGENVTQGTTRTSRTRGPRGSRSTSRCRSTRRAVPRAAARSTSLSGTELRTAIRTTATRGFQAMCCA
jgi:hypothetical protein